MKTLIVQSVNSLVYHENTDEGSRIWKISRDDVDGHLRLSKEYKICNDLDLKGVRKALAMGEYRGRPALVLEYVEGITIESKIKAGLLSLDGFLDVALQCSEILEKLTQVEIIHNRINSKNFILGSEGKVTLIDFSAAEKAPYEFSAAFVPKAEYLDDAIYFSPELVGRFSQKIDPRSDLFSLGVMFYYMLTGQHPFYSKELPEVSYAIIAQTPTAIRWLNPTVPKILEDIVLKLLAKSPEDRYQTAIGLSSDLQFCKSNVESPDKMYKLVLGKNDYSTVLNISQQVYGREEIQLQLRDYLSKIVDGDKTLLNIVGPTGAGKSAMGKIIFQECATVHGWFVSGKADRSHKGTPYYAFIEALKQLAALMISGEEGKLSWWKKRLQSSIGGMGKVLTDLIPEYKWILGEQSAVDFADVSTQSRTIYLFQRVIEAVTSQGQPLIMFLDDIDESDFSSISLIRSLISYPNIRNFMIVCTTTSELEKEYSLENELQLSEQELLQFKKIKLCNLSHKSISSLLSDTLKVNSVDNLAEIVYAKTGGNPLFVHQFIQYIIDKGMITYDFSQRQWKYNLAGISSFQATQNVIDIIITKLINLTPMGNHILKIVSCLEDSFAANQIKDLVDIDNEACSTALKMLHDTGMIFQEAHGTYKFSHDRLKQTVYDAIPEQEKKELHFKIGMWFLDRYHKDQEINIYELAKNLNLATDLIPSSLRKDQLEINHRAGLKSKSAGAFSLASEYFEHAIAAVEDKDWLENYNFILSLYLD